LYKKVQEYVTTSAELSKITSLVAGSMAFGIQPISESAVRQSQARGGNALGLQAVNQTWLVLDTGWWNADDDGKARTATRGIIDKIETAAKESGNYLPYLFMNDANFEQEVIASYGGRNVARLKDVQTAYDPQQVFQRLVPGGFKLPA
jgi:hypothetical protein